MKRITSQKYNADERIKRHFDSLRSLSAGKTSKGPRVQGAMFDYCETKPEAEP